jgi:hypothetical protein
MARTRLEMLTALLIGNESRDPKIMVALAY